MGHSISIPAYWQVSTLAIVLAAMCYGGGGGVAAAEVVLGKLIFVLVPECIGTGLLSSFALC